MSYPAVVYLNHQVKSRKDDSDYNFVFKLNMTKLKYASFDINLTIQIA